MSRTVFLDTVDVYMEAAGKMREFAHLTPGDLQRAARFTRRYLDQKHISYLRHGMQPSDRDIAQRVGDFVQFFRCVADQGATCPTCGAHHQQHRGQHFNQVRAPGVMGFMSSTDWTLLWGGIQSLGDFERWLRAYDYRKPTDVLSSRHEEGMQPLCPECLMDMLRFVARRNESAITRGEMTFDERCFLFETAPLDWVAEIITNHRRRRRCMRDHLLNNPAPGQRNVPSKGGHNA